MQSYGGFWIRVLAYLIDWIILYFASSVLSGIVMGVGFASINAGYTAVSTAMLGVAGISFVLNWLYFAILESSSWQGTVGKQALKLVVTDEQGERISFGRATGRYFAKFLSVLIFCIGFMMAGWTGRKRGLHDIVAGTLVYKANSPDLPRNSARVFE
ncbi:MAG: RDD family protein [Candidatus Andeanibacterium colombiense]|uniref:RDD family protein n=1 Tax=Candidatus Andeanibacterium colombiense TaxID=3121345 RepID=A0AAJ5X8S9_9SPHN|nr:MAG: RDD family protein [Sphingomonadaceae bacterium]